MTVLSKKLGSNYLNKKERANYLNKKAYGSTLEEIWNQYSNTDWYIDEAGVKLYKYDHGKTWAVDHILSRQKGGKNVLSNLQPLNNISNILKSGNNPLLSKKDLKLYLAQPNVNKELLKSKRGFRFVVNEIYNVYETPLIKIPAMARLVSLDNGVATIEWLHNKTTKRLLAVRMLFEKIETKRTRKRKRS